MKRYTILTVVFLMFSIVCAEQFIYRDYHYYDYVDYMVKKGYVHLRSNDIPIDVNELLRSMEQTAMNGKTVQGISQADRDMMITVYEDLSRRGDLIIRDNLAVFFSTGDTVSYNAQNSLLLTGNLPLTDVQVLINSKVPYGQKTYNDTIRALEWKGTKSIIDRAVIHYGKNGNYIAGGRFLPAWGQGLLDNMFLSRYTNAYDGMMFNLRRGIFDFTYFTSIITPSHSSFRDDSFKTFAAFHKVGIQLPYGISAAFKEIIMYTSRIPEMRYQNPFALYYFTQWNGHVDDNVIWSIELRSRRIPFAMELFVDDFQYDEQRAEAPDKIGLQFSGWIPLYIDGLMLDWEYSMITKWTGTHEYDNCIYRYYGDPMMHYIGPDSDIAGIRIKYINSKISASYLFTYRRSGEGTLELPHEIENTDPHPPFPSGVVEKTATHSFNLGYRPFKFIRIECGADIISIDNYRHIENVSDKELNIFFKGEISI